MKEQANPICFPCEGFEGGLWGVWRTQTSHPQLSFCLLSFHSQEVLRKRTSSKHSRAGSVSQIYENCIIVGRSVIPASFLNAIPCRDIIKSIPLESEAAIKSSKTHFPVRGPDMGGQLLSLLQAKLSFMEKQRFTKQKKTFKAIRVGLWQTSFQGVFQLLKRRKQREGRACCPPLPSLSLSLLVN